MGKKKNKDIWDLTPEEQMKGLDDFYEMEKGNISIMDITNVGKRLSENGLTGDLEKRIISDLRGKKVDEPEKVQAFNLDDIIASKFDKEEVVVKEPEKHIDIDTVYDKEMLGCAREIYISVNEELNRLYVDDGIAPASMSLDIASAEDLIGTYDAEDVAEKVDTMMLYIITLKHPTAIYSDAEFSSKKYNFDNIKTYNKNRFKFFTVDNTYFCYIIYEESVNEMNDMFQKYMEANGGSVDDILRYFINLAYSCGSRNNAFFVEETEYVNKFYNSEELNEKDLFYETLLYDELTETGNDSDENCIDIYDIKNLQTVVRGSIASMTGQSYFGDDDEEDDDISDDDELDDDESDDDNADSEDEEIAEVTDVKDLSKKLDQDIASDLMGEDMEPVEETKPEKSEGYTIPVIRKK